MEIGFITLSFAVSVGTLAGVLIWKRMHSHVGIGVSLWYRHEDGHVYIESRLLKSPAGYAKVPNGCKVISWNEFPMTFKNKGEFREAWERIRPMRIGDSVSLVYEWSQKQNTALMTAQRIYGSIPIYANPLPYPQDDEWRLRRGMVYCEKTGQLVPTHTLSEAAVNEILRP